MKTRNLGHRFGFALIELLVALTVIGAVVYYGARQITEAQATLIDKSVADYHNSVMQYGQRWIRDNYATALAGATTTDPYVLNVATLNAAYTANLATGNRYGHTPCILMLQPSTGVLQPVFVTEGGNDLTGGQQQRIALRMNNGGTIETISGVLRARGIGQSFDVPLTNFVSRNCSGTAASINRVAANMAYDTNTNRASFLYNTPITGNTSANTMLTNLNMGGNNITNVNNIAAATATIGGNITGDCFVDRNDPTFRVCPRTSSNISNIDANNVRAARYSGKTDASFSVVPDGASNMNNVTATTVTTSVIYDSDNVNFFIDPAANSNVRDIFLTNRRSDVPLSNMIGKFVDNEQSAVVSDGASIPAAACQNGGQTYIYLIQQDLVIPANLIIRPRATLSGSSWLISIKDGAGASNASTYFGKLGCYIA
jgi:prepilin-type N-terminal cleavage/methylation domain-containing protein